MIYYKVSIINTRFNGKTRMIVGPSPSTTALQCEGGERRFFFTPVTVTPTVKMKEKKHYCAREMRKDNL